MSQPESQVGSNEQLMLDALARLPDLVNQDEDLVRRGRHVCADILIGIGDARCYLTIDEGRLTAVETKPQRMRSAAFTISGPPSSWQNFWRPMPRPGWHDLFAMNKRGYMTIEGNLLLFMQNLQYFKDLVALPRSLGTTLGTTLGTIRNAG